MAVLAVVAGLVPAGEAAGARLHSTSRAASSQSGQVDFVSLGGSGRPYKGATDMSVSPETDAVLTGVKNQLKADDARRTAVIFCDWKSTASSISGLLRES